MHESIFSHFNGLMEPFSLGDSPIIRDAVFSITGLNSTLVHNCEEHFLIFTSYYSWRGKKKNRVLL